MLKGVCDGDLLLDSNMRIHGQASCLRRLLATKEDMRGGSCKDDISSLGYTFVYK